MGRSSECFSSQCFWRQGPNKKALCGFLARQGQMQRRVGQPAERGELSPSSQHPVPSPLLAQRPEGRACAGLSTYMLPPHPPEPWEAPGQPDHLKKGETPAKAPMA